VNEQIEPRQSQLGDLLVQERRPRNIGETMFNFRVKIAFLLLLLVCLLSACAAIKEAGRTIGHTTRDVATAIGHGTRDAAKAVGEGVKKVVKSAPEDEW
jgi:ABC-type sugar transport system substrate-binding protein